MNLPLSRPSGTLSPSGGERDGVRGPLTSSGAQCAHKVRRVLSLRERVRVRGNGANDLLPYRTIPGTVELDESSGEAGAFQK